MICPKCGTENKDNWPLYIDGEIKDGGCQDCWEDESDKMWWKMIKKIFKIHRRG